MSSSTESTAAPAASAPAPSSAPAASAPAPSSAPAATVTASTSSEPFIQNKGKATSRSRINAAIAAVKAGVPSPAPAPVEAPAEAAAPTPSGDAPVARPVSDADDEMVAAPPPTAAAPEQEPAGATPGPKASPKDWDNYFAAQRKQQAKERDLKAKEARLKDMEEAHALLTSDPVAYAQKYGGKDFGTKFVQRTLQPDRVDPLEKVGSVEQKLAQLEQRLAQKELESQIKDYVTTHRTHIASAEDAALLRGWYSEEEIPEMVTRTADAVSRRENRLLTKEELSGMVTSELKIRLERLGKTEAGQKFLRSLIVEPPKAPVQPQVKTKAAPAAPKTLTNDQTTSAGAPPKKRELPADKDKRRKFLIHEAMTQSTR